MPTNHFLMGAFGPDHLKPLADFGAPSRRLENADWGFGPSASGSDEEARGNGEVASSFAMRSAMTKLRSVSAINNNGNNPPITLLNSDSDSSSVNAEIGVQQRALSISPTSEDCVNGVNGSTSDHDTASYSGSSSGGRHTPPTMIGLYSSQPVVPPPAAKLVNNKSHDQRLLDLTDRTHYNIVQRNGQRIFGGPPPGWTGAPPPKGSEIFVGKVPRDCYEEELVPVFESVGKIYELRLLMDFSGSNRGYFFVRYTCREDAKMAVQRLNNYEIRPGKFLGVIQSVDNRKLWISGIPKNRTAAEIKADMANLTDGVRGVILYPSQTDKSKTRGYAFVEYESHRAAALARRKLVPGRVYLCGHEIEKVDWAEPENEVDEDTMSKVRVLFIRNLMGTTTEQRIRGIFHELSHNQVERVKKTKDYAFVHFTTREAAELAMRGANNLQIDDAEIEVTWSKPVDKQNYNTRKQLTKVLSSPNMTVGALDHPVMPIQGSVAGCGLRGAPGTAPPRALVRKLNGGVDCCMGKNGQNLPGNYCLSPEHQMHDSPLVHNFFPDSLVQAFQHLKVFNDGGLGYPHHPTSSLSQLGVHGDPARLMVNGGAPEQLLAQAGGLTPFGPQGTIPGAHYGGFNGGLPPPAMYVTQGNSFAPLVNSSPRFTGTNATGLHL